MFKKSKLLGGASAALGKVAGEVVGDVVSDTLGSELEGTPLEGAEDVVADKAAEVAEEKVTEAAKDALGVGEDEEQGEQEQEEDQEQENEIQEKVVNELKERFVTMASGEEEEEDVQVNGDDGGEEKEEEDGEDYWRREAEESKAEEGEREPSVSEASASEAAGEELTPLEKFKAAAPPPQPAPRATYEERKVNLKYWQQQSLEEEEQSAERQMSIPEVVEDLVEDQHDGDDEEEENYWKRQAAEAVGEVMEKRQEVAEAKEDEHEEVVVTVTEEKTVLVNEKNLSNEEVLKKMIAEGEVEPKDIPNIHQLLDAAKKTRKPKTETFIIRTKKRQESIKKAIDFNAMAIVIEDKNKIKEGPGGAKTIKSMGRTFEVSKAAPNAFQVRKASVIQPASETVVTKKWIENAIGAYEHEKKVEIVQMNFETKSEQGQAKYYEAKVTAKVGEQNATKSYSWIIRAAPKSGVNVDPSDKDTYIVSDLGTKIATFVGAKKLRKPLSLPFQPVIYADARYAIFDDISAYKTVTGFLDMDHTKQALRALAKLHAMSYAYFNQGTDDIKGFSEVLKMIVAKNFQPTAQQEDRNSANTFLNMMFENMLSVVKSNGEEMLAEQTKNKFGDRLYPIYKDAFASSSTFSVLCHGFPMSENLRYLYDASGRPTDVRLTGFQRARYSHAATDLQLLFCTAVGDRVDDQTEFLTRFIYWEALSSALRSLGIPNATDFDSFKQTFRKLQVFGCLTGAMRLAEILSPPKKGATASAARRPQSTGGGFAGGVPTRRATGKKVFESKIAGKFGSGRPSSTASASSSTPRLELTGPMLRIKELLERALQY